MTTNAKQFQQLVKDNKMIDAKKLFESEMQKRISTRVSDMRKSVAQKFFNKQ